MQNLWQIADKINIPRSRVLFSEPMRDHTSFRIGGPADLFIRIVSQKELIEAMEALEAESLPFFVLGGGANILVADSGIRGAVLDLGGMDRLSIAAGEADATREVSAEAGISMDSLCLSLLSLGIGGLGNFYGMPGSLGGSLFMNARCYEQDICAHLGSMKVRRPGGDIFTYVFRAEDWEYKRSPLQADGSLSGAIVLEASFSLPVEDPVCLASLMRSRRTDRYSKGHYRAPSAGSVFKNNRSFGAPSGALLEGLGLKGFRIGDAMVSPWHANIFINAGRASAKDMLKLVEYAQEQALTRLGIRLEPEVRYIG